MSRRTFVPSYSLHKPSGRAVVKVKGRSFYLGPHGSPESREAYARIVAELLAGLPITPPATAPKADKLSPPGFTVNELLARYQRYAATYYLKNGNPTSEVAAIRCAVRFVSDRYCDLPASEFDVIGLRVVREAMVDAGLTRGVVNQNTGRVVRAFRWAVTEKLYPGESLLELQALPGLRRGRTRAIETAPVQPVEDAAVDATTPLMPTVIAAMVRLQRSTGMRPGEVCLVRPCDVDRSSEVWVYRPESHKTEHHGRERSIYIGPTGQDILRPFLLRPATEYCFRPDRALAVPIEKKKYSTTSYGRAVARACDRAFPAPDGLSEMEQKAWQQEHRWSPNQLRHTFATKARQTFGLEAAQVLLGHASADITQVYAERDAVKAIEVAKLIG